MSPTKKKLKFGKLKAEIISAFLIVSFSAFCPGSIIINSYRLAVPGGGGGCTTLVESGFGSSIAGYIGFGESSGNDWIASTFVASETSSRCGVEISIYKVNSGFDFRIEIWAFDAAANAGDGAPGTLISAGATIAAGDVSSFPTFAFIKSGSMSAALTNGTTYCIVARRMSGTADAANFMRMEDHNYGDPGHSSLWKSSDGSTWTADDIANLNVQAFKTYK